MLSARQKSSGKCHCEGTPRRTATRGCRTEGLASGEAGWWLGGEDKIGGEEEREVGGREEMVVGGGQYGGGGWRGEAS